jgi:DNA repair protein RadC
MSNPTDSATQKLTIKDWAEEDKPREKMLLKGWRALSDAELIAILIATGTGNETAVDVAKKLMAIAGSSIDKLARFTIKDMQKVKGIGQAKAITIGAALELGRRRSSEDREQTKKISSSRDAYLALKPYLHDLEVEQFMVILLNRANAILKIVSVGVGGVSGVIADVKVIFKTALENNACGIILSHNHPSGNTNPSKADLDLTKTLMHAGKTLDIPVLDHIIYTNHGYKSFADEGIIEHYSSLIPDLK